MLDNSYINNSYRPYDTPLENAYLSLSPVSSKIRVNGKNHNKNTSINNNDDVSILKTSVPVSSDDFPPRISLKDDHTADNTVVFVSMKNQFGSQTLAENHLKTKPKLVICPYCYNEGPTLIDKRLSITNLFCCIFTLIIPWVIFQQIRGKDLSFYNATHYCSYCKNILAKYNAC